MRGRQAAELAAQPAARSVTSPTHVPIHTLSLALSVIPMTYDYCVLIDVCIVRGALLSVRRPEVLVIGNSVAAAAAVRTVARRSGGV